MGRQTWNRSLATVTSDIELGLMNGTDQVSIPSAQPEHGQHSSGDDDTDGIVFIMKGVHEGQVSNHVPGGTKLRGPNTHPEHLQ